MQQEREDLVDYWKRTGRKVLWGTLLRHELEAAMASEPVVLLPIGSVEQHGPACPLDGHRRRLRGLRAGSAGNR